MNRIVLRLSALMLVIVTASNSFAGDVSRLAYDDPNGDTHVVCQNDATQSYELYIPATAPAVDSPILYGFDPGGDGKGLLLTLAAAAAANGWMVAVSNNSKNGAWSTIFTAQDAVLQDREARWSLHPTRRFAGGMSGGARAFSSPAA